MKFIQTASRWGNLYRHRYYLDGRRVSLPVWQAALSAHNRPSDTYRDEATSFGFRTIWEWN